MSKKSKSKSTPVPYKTKVKDVSKSIPSPEVTMKRWVKKSEDEKLRVGPKMKEIDLEIVKSCGTKGLPIKYVQVAVGVANQTWYDRCKVCPEIMEAYNTGKREHCERIMNKIEEISTLTNNVTGLIYLAKAVHNLNESTKIEHVGGGKDDPAINVKSEIDIKIENMTPEQRKKRIDELISKRNNR